ncbi:MAG: FtsX-like permease family protein [Balneolaceae bacterium]|nr:FtsX-like permease family protein [Balneolaceae bacterium]
MVTERFKQPGEEARYEVIGVIRDFHFDFLWNPISPLVLKNDPSEFRVANIRLAPGEQKPILAKLEEIWSRITEVAPFAYDFYSEQIAEVYHDFRELVTIIGFLAVIAIVIACLGLLAMAHYDLQSRVKEIGVRKVLGARIEDLLILLTSDYAKPVGIAFVLGIPVIYYLTLWWLQIFKYKMALDLWVILLGLSIVLLFKFSTVGIQTLKAAMDNPVQSLQSK